ncbi:hypothetical protein [Rhodanobacter sp. L36]|uniref:hypothetical protein n=1 Tax=Rhodanobacter sp. L36 TaxID=1747221 RepID=UPI00131E504A|nr:hypothetical protein [Rhodanobacter sp. L36]
MSTAQHSRSIDAAAKAALKPLGCVQKGRSRTWLDDHAWWIGVVEFQPSAWAQGSYLNVGACWLWYEKEYLSFNTGGRVENFQPSSSDDQFSLIARSLAKRASEEVVVLRERFKSVTHVHAWLADQQAASIWDHYHLAVAAGLAGATELSKRSFADVMSDPEDRPWAADIRRRSTELMRCLGFRSGFDAEVMGTVERARNLLGLPSIEGQPSTFD